MLFQSCTLYHAATGTAADEPPRNPGWMGERALGATLPVMTPIAIRLQSGNSSPRFRLR